MGHPLRIDEPGLVHHVYGLASDHREAFRDDEDCAVFEWLLGEGSMRFGLRVFALCLMSTHYHAAVLSIDGRLSEAMQWILSRYVRFHNAKYATNGSLFRGRFKSANVESEIQLGNVIRYIHANALDLPGIDLPEDHRWSTCAAHAGSRPASRWLLRAAVAYVLRNDSRLSRSSTKSHRSGAAEANPVRVPDAVVAAARRHFARHRFEVRPHPVPASRGPTHLAGVTRC